MESERWRIAVKVLSRLAAVALALLLLFVIARVAWEALVMLALVRVFAG